MLLILIALEAANLFIKSGNSGLTSENTVSSLSSEEVKELATKLANRNLYTRAAKVWQDYLSASKLPDAENAKTLFQIAMLYEKAGSFAEAIEYYYRSDYHSADSPCTNDGMSESELEALLDKLTKGHRSVWLVASEAESCDKRGLVKAWLDGNGKLVDEKEFAMVKIYRYEWRVPTTPP